MNFSHLMTDSVTVEAQSGKGQFGDPTYASPASVKGRLQRGTSRRDSDLVHDAVFYTHTNIEPLSRVTLSDGTARVARRVYKTHSIDGSDTLYTVLLGP